MAVTNALAYNTVVLITNAKKFYRIVKMESLHEENCITLNGFQILKKAVCTKVADAVNVLLL